MQSSLAQEFNKTATAAYRVFPKELERLTVLLVPSSDAPVYVSPTVARALTQSTAAVNDSVRELAKTMHDLNAVGVASNGYTLGGTPVNLIALQDSSEIKGLFSDRFTREMDIIFTLDHEIGHHIVKNGHPTSRFFGASPHLTESAADAFAMLRHIQRFGKNTDQAGNLAQKVAGYAVLFADTEHYTTNALQRAIKVADEMGDYIFSLPLHQTAELAAKIAAESELDRKALKRIRDAYKSCARNCEARIGNRRDVLTKLYDGDKDACALYCRETLAVMRRHQNDPAVFKAGKEFLNYPPVKKFMMEAAAPNTNSQRSTNPRFGQ